MINLERRKQILDILATEGSINTNLLSERLGVTGATIRTDLRDLAREGAIIRYHGGVRLPEKQHTDELSENYMVRSVTHVDLKEKIDLIVDPEVLAMENFIVGANETDYHFKNVNYGRDFEATKVADVRNVVEGDKCPKCGKPLAMCRGIEVGHIFKLGTKYSDALHCIYLDKDGKENSMIMGCYGIGVSRTLAAIIEQHYDENGIIWPMSVAPYQVIVVPTTSQDETVVKMANEIHDALEKAGAEVLIDDREERAGVKFKDADLIGIPIRITVGRKAAEGKVEYKLRAGSEVVEMTAEEAIAAALKEIEASK